MDGYLWHLISLKDSGRYQAQSQKSCDRPPRIEAFAGSHGRAVWGQKKCLGFLSQPSERGQCPPNEEGLDRAIAGGNGSKAKEQVCLLHGLLWRDGLL